MGGRLVASTRWAGTVGWSAFLVGLPLRAIALWVAGHPGRDPIEFAYGIGFWAFAAAIVLGGTSSLVGAIVVARRPGNAVGWVFVAAGAVQAVLTPALAGAGAAGAANPGSLALFAIWLNGIADFALPFSAVAIILVIYPDGRLLSRRWWLVAIMAAIGGLLRTLEIGFGDARLALAPAYLNPYRMSGPMGSIWSQGEAHGVGSILLIAAAVAAAASLSVRFRRATLDGRRQIQWLLLSGALVLVCSIPLAYSQLVSPDRRPALDSVAIFFTSLCLPPFATLVAITRYRLYEIDRLINRTIVYGSLTAILAGVFTAAVALAQRLFVTMTGERSDAAIVATTLVVATLYAPIRKRLEALVDRRFKYEQVTFGAYREDLRRSLSLTDSTAAAGRLAREVAAELGVEDVGILDARGRASATVGIWPIEGGIRVPVRGGHGAISALVIRPVDGGRPINPDRLAAVETVASLAAQALRAPDAR